MDCRIAFGGIDVDVSHMEDFVAEYCGVLNKMTFYFHLNGECLVVDDQQDFKTLALHLSFHARLSWRFLAQYQHVDRLNMLDGGPKILTTPSPHDCLCMSIPYKG